MRSKYSAFKDPQVELPLFGEVVVGVDENYDVFDCRLDSIYEDSKGVATTWLDGEHSYDVIDTPLYWMRKCNFIDTLKSIIHGEEVEIPA